MCFGTVSGFLRTQGTTSADKIDSSGGNLGIQDIAAALHWIQANIKEFGGDKSRVTIVGHDTGAALVNLLFVSPNSKGTFAHSLLISAIKNATDKVHSICL